MDHIQALAAQKARFFTPLLSEGARLRCDSIAFTRSFEHLEREYDRTEFAITKSQKFIPYDTSAPKGARTIKHRIITDLGEADFVDPMADDLPDIDVKGDEFEVETAGLGERYSWSLEELDAIALDPSIRLDVERKRSAREAMDRKHDEIAAIGSAKHGRQGFINSSLVPTVSPITGTWASATSDQIIADVLKLIDAPRVATLEHYPATDLLVGNAAWAILNRPRANTDTTIREWLLKNVDGLSSIDVWGRLDLANAGGNGPRLIAYHKHPKVLKYHCVNLFEEVAPQYKNLKAVVPCRGKTGFTEIRRPKAIAFMDGT